MKETDPLKSLLREWEAPECPDSLDKRVRADFRALHPSLWHRLWTTRISLPVPVLAAMLVIAVALFWLRPPASTPVPSSPSGSEHITRIEAAGFKPLPDGAARIIRAGERKQ